VESDLAAQVDVHTEVGEGDVGETWGRIEETPLPRHDDHRPVSLATASLAARLVT